MSRNVHDMYLGDGVYASYDGYHVWLDLRGQDNTTKIALEPKVLETLNKFLDKVAAHKTEGGSHE